jgi:hypothetical protein
MEVDFQNYKLESSQNNNIEKPAIDVIRSLYSGGKLNESEAMKLFAWTELHLIRNEKFRYKPDVNYADEYDSLLEVEKNLLIITTASQPIIVKKVSFSLLQIIQF